MQPYPNPNYFAQYMQPPHMNPYMQRMEQLQQFQQILQPQLQNNPNLTSGLNMLASLGKVVESMDIVKVTDIPMDGNVYYFPKADGSEIYSKQFMPNGQTRILTFKPLLDGEPYNSSSEDEKLNLGALDEFKTVFREQMETLNERLDKIEKNIRQNTTNKSKKEVADE